jgi:GT2 family glycosyltransferase
MNNTFLSLVVCTYQRPKAIQTLIESVSRCILKPDIILIIDGSSCDETGDYVTKSEIPELRIIYYKVSSEQRGLTRQRNFGIEKLPDETEIVAFLDDDIVVEPDYFQQLVDTFNTHPGAIGVGGIDLKENQYFKKEEGVKYSKFKFYELDGWVAKEPLRYEARKILGLMTALQPGLIPEYSNGRSQLPPSNKIYEVEHFMGMSMSFKKSVFEKVRFSSFFEGYGLYEDFDFCVRVLPYGTLYVNTNAKVWHYHEPAGRPDFFKYGKMVVRNGWYVWRERYPNPSLISRLKWHAVSFLLAQIRLFNILSGPNRIDASKEYLGRTVEWFLLLFKKPHFSN